MSSQGSQTWLRSHMSKQGSQTWLRSPMSSQGSQTWLRTPMSSQGSQAWLRSPMSRQGSQTWTKLSKNRKMCSIHLNPFILSWTNYWRGWSRWRLKLIFVFHFVISCLSFFDFWILTITGIFKLFLHIKRKELLAQIEVTLSRIDYPDLT